MVERLRVLIVEDSEDDAELLVRELKRGAGEVEWLRVESGPAMRSALETREWDLVVADFHLPRFSALGALEVLRDTGLDIPSIIVSGSVGEEIAVQSMRAGARDFLLKGSLKRLLPAVERELEQADQRRARREAEERNRLLAAIVQSSDDAIISTDVSGNILTWNQGAERTYGYSAAEMKGRPVSLLEPAERRGEVAAYLVVLRTGAGLRRYETVRMRKDGVPVEVAVSLFPIPGAAGEIVGFASIARDITEKRRAEEALRASEERYRLLFENNPQPLWVFDEKTLAFLAVNQAACRHYGYSGEEFLAMTIRDIRPKEEVAPLLERLAAEPDEYQESGIWRHRKKDDGVIEVEITSHPLRFDGHKAQLVLAVDVTERRLLEEQLRQAQKMEAVGQLAGGIAHDFNNLLTAILGYSELLLSRVDKESPMHGDLDEIRKSGERAASLTRQLLAFSRRQVLDPKVLDVNALVGNLEKMLRRLMGEDVELIALLEPSVGRIRADPGQVDQVLMNFAVNARDAMPRGGTLTIETQNADLDASYAQEHMTVRPGSYVMIAVTDTGTGMDAATKAHIFEPFFTTKEKGKGTGLGLATVYGIVKQSGGYIWVYSEPGRGTTFKIYFPRVESPAERLSRREPKPIPQGTETILLVEDEQAVRTLTRTILKSKGYTVLEAGRADEALAMAASRPGVIDLLLTDVVMPEMGGSDLATRLGELRPGIKVLYMSGYTDDAIVRQGLVAQGMHFLQKPFTPDALAAKVRDALDA